MSAVDVGVAVGVAVAVHFVAVEPHVHVVVVVRLLELRRGVLALQYCKTEDQLADMLTKGLSRDTFQRLRALVMPRAGHSGGVSGGGP